MAPKKNYKARQLSVKFFFVITPPSFLESHSLKIFALLFMVGSILTAITTKRKITLGTYPWWFIYTLEAFHTDNGLPPGWSNQKRFVLHDQLKRLNVPDSHQVSSHHIILLNSEGEALSLLWLVNG